MSASLLPSLVARVRAVHPGDLILVRTPGRFYSFFRSLASHDCDHIAVVMPNQVFLHVGPPSIRLLPLQLLLTHTRQPIVTMALPFILLMLT